MFTPERGTGKVGFFATLSDELKSEVLINAARRIEGADIYESTILNLDKEAAMTEASPRSRDPSCVIA